MEQSGTRMRGILAGLFLIVVLLATSYLQIILGFSTYVALAVCFVAVFVAAAILLGSSA